MAPSDWLGATAIHSRSAETSDLLRSLAALCRMYPNLHLILNFFDEPPLPPSQLASRLTHPRIEATSIPGMKTLFWRRILTPSRIANASLVWVFDSDIVVHPGFFPLGSLASTLLSLDATLLQPAIRAQIQGTHHMWLRSRPTHMSCVATTARWVEMQTPLFSAAAWAHVHAHMLSKVSEDDLAVSDFGLDTTWCALLAHAFPGKPTCLVLPSTTAIHSNSHTIERYMPVQVAHKERSCAGTCKTLQKLYRGFWMNYSHHTGLCWGSQPDQKGFVVTGKFGLEGMTVKARSPRADLIAPLSNETDEDLISRRWVGATSTHFPQLRSERAHFDSMVTALRMMLNAHHKLRIVVNFDDISQPSGANEQPRMSFEDRRIISTFVNGHRALFWSSVLIPMANRGEAEMLWLFSPTVPLTPSLHPLNQMIYTLHESRASVVGFDGRLVQNVLLRSTPCVAVTATSLDLQSAFVIKPSLFVYFLQVHLSRLSHDVLKEVDSGLGELLCRVADLLVAQSRERMGCVRQLVPHAFSHLPTSCNSECVQSLHHLFPKIFTAFVSSESEVCWSASTKGLKQIGEKKRVHPKTEPEPKPAPPLGNRALTSTPKRARQRRGKKAA